MYKTGFSFKVTKNGIIGVVDGISNSLSSKIYSVSFYENGNLYYMADVFEETITNNLKYGHYVAL
jgi:hypothetical protein